MAPICPTCKNLDPQNFNQETTFGLLTPKKLISCEIAKLPHTIRIINIPRQDLIKSVTAGCSTCALLDAARKAVATDMVEKYRSYVSVWVYNMTDPLYFSLPNQQLAGCFTFDRLASTAVSVTGIIFTPNTGITHPQPVLNLGRSRLIDEDAMSPHSLLQAQKWFNECIMTHKQCQSSGTVELPPRVLKVGRDGDQVYLVESLELRDRYATLSYCKGTITSYSLHSNNLEGLLRGMPIPMTQLPKTFLDAIAVTRHLGLPYLWIDVLCSIQNCEIDRQNTLDHMQDIYGNAALNISADHGINQLVGLSSKQRAFGSSKQIRPGVYVRRLLGLSPDWDSSHIEYGLEHPLSSQAWALQERALSARVLHFSANELSFECDKEVQCECCSVVRPANLRPARTLFRKLKYNRDPDTWSNLVTFFTSLELNRQSDALGALSGLASKVGSITGKTYIAGLWKEDLPWNLLWFRNPSARPKAGAHHGYVFPSWSWAAVHGEVCMFKNPSLEVDDQSMEQSNHFESYLQIDQSKIACENSFALSFPNILKFTLRVYGWRVWIPARNHAGQTLAEIFALYLSDIIGLPPIKGAFTHFDDTNGELAAAGRPFHLLLIGLMDAMYFLILHKAETRAASRVQCYYQRVGRFGCLFDEAACSKLRNLEREWVVLA